jgi:hypothetical protein
MRLGVDTAREPADDDDPGRGEVAPDPSGDLTTVRRAGPGADDRHRRPCQQLNLGGAPQEEPRRRVVNRAQQRREGRIGAREEAEAERREPVELRPGVETLGERGEACASRRLDDVRVAGCGEGGERELVHAASSRGER